VTGHDALSELLSHDRDLLVADEDGGLISADAYDALLRLRDSTASKQPVSLVLGRSGALLEHVLAPAGVAETVTRGPFEYVEITYDLLRVSPDGDTIGGFRDGFWWLDGDSIPFSDLDVFAESS
jgi:hypothetical protein